MCGCLENWGSQGVECPTPGQKTVVLATDGQNRHTQTGSESVLSPKAKIYNAVIENARTSGNMGVGNFPFRSVEDSYIKMIPRPSSPAKSR